MIQFHRLPIKGPFAVWFSGFLAVLLGVHDNARAALELGDARTIVGDADYWWAKALADFDGDGVMDFAACNNNANGGWFAWYETSADARSWTRHIIADAAPNGEAFASGSLDAGDLDNDGDIDLLGIAHTGEWDDQSAPSTLYWYENDSLAWVPRLIGEADAFIKDIKIADFNADGKPDIAAVLFDTHSLVVFRQDSPTSWVKVQDFEIANLHEGMDVGDIDGDGDPDVAANGYWVESPGDDLTGPWEVRSIDARWHSDPAGGNFRNNATKVFCRDITGDGRVEVFISDSENAERILWYQSSDPTNGAWTGHTIADGFESVHTLQVFDMDRDGDFDLFAGENGGQVPSARTVVFLNDGDNLGWTEHLIDAAGAYNSLLGDVEGDGDPDIWLISSHEGNTFELIPNTASPRSSLDEWTYIEVANQHSRVFGLAFGDVTGDGLSDIVSGRYLYRNPGSDMTGPWQRNDLGDIDALFVVDVDGDPYADVISYNSAGLFWHEANDADGSSWSSALVGAGHGADHSISSQGYRLGQIVPGGKDELIVSADDEAVYYSVPEEPSDGNWPSVVIASGTGGEGIDAGDVDRDGLNDVAGRSGDSIVWWKNPGTGASGWTASMIGSTPNAADRISLADVNRDGRLDLVASEETGGTSGSGTWWFEQPADLALPWPRRAIAQQATTNSMEVADFDGDGDPDVVTGEHRGAEKVIVWENDGAGVFTAHEVDAGKESHLGVRPVDLDGDGDLDIVSIAWDDPESIHLWRNDGGAGTVRIAEALDEGRECFRIQTPSATYFFDKAGGGFTSILDRSGTDWVGWNPSNGSSGAYRGLPNTGELHPGYEGGATTTDNPLNTPLRKVTLETSRAGYVARWEFYPDYARMTMRAVPQGGTYWIVYEGVPGGAVEEGDRLFLSNGRDYSANDDHPWSSASAQPNDFEDIGNTSGSATQAEWGFFAASEFERSFFLARTDDAIEDDYWQMQDNMTVFGFGRNDANEPLLAAADQELVIGFVDSKDPTIVKSKIHAAWKNLGGAPQVAKPVISPVGGTHVGSVTVTLSSATSGGAIHYTTDGSEPLASSALYSQPLKLTKDTLLQARAFRTGRLESEIAEASFTIIPDDAPSSIATGLIAHWRFDEREGASVPDATGLHDAALQGPTRAVGKFGRALRFDGTDDFVDAGSWDVSGQAITVCAWLRADRFDHLPSQDARILSKAVGVQEADHFWMLSTIEEGAETRLRFRLKTGGLTTTLIASQGDLAAGEWIHVAAVYDGSTMILYKNGESVGSAAKSGSLTAGPGAAVWLGDNPSTAGDRPFEGLLDDVRIYERALAPQELAYLAAWSPLTTIQDWGAFYGVVTNEPTIDPDGDGASLLSEFAFGLDPNAADAFPLLAAKKTRGLPIGTITPTDPRRLAIQYDRRIHASDLIYTVEFSSDLKSDWSASGRPETVSRLDADWERITVEDTLSMENAERRFARVRIQHAP